MVTRRLALAADLITLRAQIGHAEASKADTTRRALATRIIRLRQAATRRKLLGLPGEAIDGAVTVTGVASYLADQLAQAEAAGPVEFTKAKVQRDLLRQMLQQLSNAELAAGAFNSPELVNLSAGALPSDDDLTAVAESYVKAAKLPQAFIDDAKVGLMKADIATKDVFRQLSILEPDQQEKWLELSSKISDMRRRADKLYTESWKSWDAVAASKMRDESSAIYKEARAISESQTAESAAVLEKVQALAAEGKAELVKAGGELYDRVLSKSRVTAEQATAWATGIPISTSARARLRKMGYLPDQARIDMAEFYRLVDGKIGAVTIVSEGGKRANTSGVGSFGTDGIIRMGSQFDKRVLWHELAHHLESDPVARAAASRYIRMRAISPDTKSLRSITKNTGYRPNETAFEDHFFDAYVGKDYGHGTTEVFSMGIESFSDKEMLGRRIAMDPDTFEFVAGYMLTPQTAMGDAIKGLNDILQDNTREALEEGADNRRELAIRAAKTVTIDTQSPPHPQVHALYGEYYQRALKSKYIGRFSDSVYLYSGMVKARLGRKTSGHLAIVVKPQTGPHGEATDRVSMYPNYIFSKDLNEVKAIYANYLRSGLFVREIQSVDENSLAEVANGAA